MVLEFGIYIGARYSARRERCPVYVPFEDFVSDGHYWR